MKFIRRATLHALPTISPPDLKLHVWRNDSSSSCVDSDRRTQVVFALYGVELELEDISTLAPLTPRVNEMKDAIVGPYALSYLLVNADSFRWPGAAFGPCPDARRDQVVVFVVARAQESKSWHTLFTR